MWQRFKMWWQGYRRIGPKGARGRVYVHKDDPGVQAGDATIRVATERKRTLYAKHTSAATGEVRYWNLTTGQELSEAEYQTIMGAGGK